MFRLTTPISCTRPVSDFDDITTILSHSSLTGSRKTAPWQQYTEEDGSVFYIEFTQASSLQKLTTHKTDASSVCSLCSTRSCHSCASEDTGYSSDADVHPTQTKNQKSLLNLSHESLPSHLKVADFEGDDGVSVDLIDCERNEQAQMNGFYVGDCREQLMHKPNVRKTVAHVERFQNLDCSRTSNLCERHSNKLCVKKYHTSLPCHGSELYEPCRCQAQSIRTSQSKHKFQDSLKEIVIHLRPSGHLWDGRSKISWLESVLGIIPGHSDCDHNHDKQRDDYSCDRIVIKGLAPDGIAAKSNELFSGDQVYSINGKQVNWSNLDAALASLFQTRKVRLMIKRDRGQPDLASSCITTDCHLLLSTSDVLGILQENYTATSASNGKRRDVAGMEGVSVLYMSMEGLDSEHRNDKDDIVYQFPGEDSVLSTLRGSFYTLHHLLIDNVHTDVRMCTVSVDEDPFHVTCQRHGKDLLILSASATRLLRLVQLVFGSVEQAFNSEQHHNTLDAFLILLFTSRQPQFQGDNVTRLSHILGYMDYLPLPDSIMLSVSKILTGYEAADFADRSESFYGCRRAFTILGSMALYKSRVICCHLSPEDAMDVGLYLYCNGLLSLSARHPLHQLLVWREIFPTRFCHEVAGINSIFGYSEPHARWFLMVVGMKNTLLACILEAGGCSTHFEGVCLPDPFYVDQARATLMQLQTVDIISACEARLSGQGLLVTTNVKTLISHLALTETSHRGLESFLKNTASLAFSINSSHHGNGLLAHSNNTIPDYGRSSRTEWREWENSSTDLLDRFSNSGYSCENHLKSVQKKDCLFPLAVPDLSNYRPGFAINNINHCKLRVGKENTLLVFCQVNEQEGMLITSGVDGGGVSVSDSLYSQVVDNFCCCVTRIHENFTRAASFQTYPNEGVLEAFHGDMSLSSCQEEGVMFTCDLDDNGDGRKMSHSIVYWVVGRKLKTPSAREVYACFHETTPQNIVELAFRLNLGSFSCT